MEIAELLVAMGVPVLQARPEGRGITIGDPPGCHAESVIVGGVPTVVQCFQAMSPSLVEDLLHEACHLVLGPRSLDEEIESGLIVYQWALAQELDPLQRRWARHALADYGIFWTDSTGRQRSEIGSDDEVFASTEWLDMEAQARAFGLVDAQGKPKLGLGVHADWREWIAEHHPEAS